MRKQSHKLKPSGSLGLFYVGVVAFEKRKKKIEELADNNFLPPQSND